MPSPGSRVGGLCRSSSSNRQPFARSSRRAAPPHAHACAAVVRCAARAALHSPWHACPWRRSGTGSVAQPQQSVPTAGARPPAPQAPLAPVPQVPASQSFLAHFGNLLSWATTPRAAVPRSTLGGRAFMGSPMAPYTAYANSLATSLVAPGLPPSHHAASLPVELPPAWLRGQRDTRDAGLRARAAVRQYQAALAAHAVAAAATCRRRRRHRTPCQASGTVAPLRLSAVAVQFAASRKAHAPGDGRPGLHRRRRPWRWRRRHLRLQPRSR